MSIIENVTMTGAVLIAMGVLGHGWSLVIALKESLISRLKVLRKGSPGRAPALNRSKRRQGRMHSDHNIVESDESLTTEVVEDTCFELQESEIPSYSHGIEPSEPWPISKTKAGVHFPYADLHITHAALSNHNERIKVLEDNAKQSADNMTKAVVVLEKMTTNMLGRDKRIAEVEDRLRDAIFILYGGKKPVEDDATIPGVEEAATIPGVDRD